MTTQSKYCPFHPFRFPLFLGKDRGKPPGVHDPTRTHTPEGYVPLGRYPGVGQEECYAKVHPHKVVPQRLPPHSLRAARVVVAQHLRCTRTQQQWGLPWVPLVGLTALTALTALTR